LLSCQLVRYMSVTHMLHMRAILSRFLLCPSRGAEYCDQPTCLSVRKHISGTAGPIDTKFCVRISCGCGSILLWQGCATICTSGFMDDVTFSRNGRDAERWWLTRATTAVNGMAIPGRSLMSMNACCFFHSIV